MVQESNQPQTGQNMPRGLALGAHELLDADEAIDALVGGLEHYVIYGEFIQDGTLRQIMQHQQTALSQLYNSLIESLKTGQDPSVKTQTYEMPHSNTKTTFGMQPASAKAPVQTVSELDDACMSSAMLSQLKAIASAFTLAALEASHPVLRRIFADSIPNLIEMAYEIYLYQNERQYYEVPQLSAQDTQTIIHSFAPANSQPPYPNH